MPFVSLLVRVMRNANAADTTVGAAGALGIFDTSRLTNRRIGRGCVGAFSNDGLTNRTIFIAGRPSTTWEAEEIAAGWIGLTETG